MALVPPGFLADWGVSSARNRYNRAVFRRHAIGLLVGACSRGQTASAGTGNLDAYVGSPRAGSQNATAVLVEVSSRRLIGAGGSELARRSLQPPGSTLKPIVLSALMESGRLKADETFLLSGATAHPRPLL